MDLPEVLYHVTDSKNAMAVEIEGIAANEDGEVFLITTDMLANEIAKNQIFVDEYALFEVYRTGITGEVKADNVAELSAPMHRVVVQERIEPDHLALCGVFRTERHKPTDWDYCKNEHCGISREQTDKLFEAGTLAEQRRASGMPDEEVSRFYEAQVKRIFD